MIYAALLLFVGLFAPGSSLGDDSLWIEPAKPEIALLGKKSLDDFHSKPGTECFTADMSMTPKDGNFEDAYWYISDAFCLLRADADKVSAAYDSLRKWLLTPENFPVGNKGIPQLKQYKRVDVDDQKFAGLVEHKVFIVLKGFLFFPDYYYTVINRPSEKKNENGKTFALPWDSKTKNVEKVKGTPLERIMGLWYMTYDEKAENPYLYYRYWNAADFKKDFRTTDKKTGKKKILPIVVNYAKQVHTETMERLKEVTQ